MPDLCTEEGTRSTLRIELHYYSATAILEEQTIPYSGHASRRSVDCEVDLIVNPSYATLVPPLIGRCSNNYFTGGGQRLGHSFSGPALQLLSVQRYLLSLILFW